MGIDQSVQAAKGGKPYVNGQLKRESTVRLR